MADPYPDPKPLFARLEKLNDKSRGFIEGYTSAALQCLEAAIAMCEKFEADARKRPALSVVSANRRG